MSGPRAKLILRTLFTALGAIAIVTGVLVVVAGPSGIPGSNLASATVDNELRFFAVFWIAFGVIAIRVAPRVDVDTSTVRALALALFAGGVARAVSWLSAGEPHPLFAILMVSEVVGAPLVVAWQARLSGHGSPESLRAAE